MPKLTLTRDGDAAQADTASHVTVARPITLDTTTANPVVGGSIDSVRKEIDDAFADMKTFLNLEPDEIMRMCGGHSARLSELRVRIQRVEGPLQQWRDLRTKEIEPTLDELQRQYQIASRLHAVREFDLKMMGGQM